MELPKWFIAVFSWSGPAAGYVHGIFTTYFMWDKYKTGNRRLLGTAEKPATERRTPDYLKPNKWKKNYVLSQLPSSLQPECCVRCLFGSKAPRRYTWTVHMEIFKRLTCPFLKQSNMKNVIFLVKSHVKERIGKYPTPFCPPPERYWV